MRGDNVMGAVTTEINGRPTLKNVKGFLCKTTDDVKKLQEKVGMAKECTYI